MSVLRITGGSLRGRRVPLPPHELRATSGRARQAFFNIVSRRIEGADFLDLFAGSGIFSLEAVSRGAKSALAIDQSNRAMTALRAMAQEWNLPIETVAADTLVAVSRIRQSRTFDVVYADPPYDYPRYADLLSAIDRLPLARNAVVGIEHHAKSELGRPGLHNLEFRRTAKYGTVAISIFDGTGGDSPEI